MKRYVALLRGINVGGNNKVEMVRLKKLFEDMGFSNVSTYINSGNVIFSAEKMKVDTKQIEKTLKNIFGFPIRVLVRSEAVMKQICKDIPEDWQNDKEQKTDVLFLWDGYDTKKSLALIKTNPKVDTLRYVAKSIVWHIEKKDYSKSGMNKYIGTEIYKNMTARNVNTVRKIVDIMRYTEGK